MKLNQKGFGTIEVILVLVVITAASVVGWVVYTKIQVKNKEINTKQSELQQAQSKVEELDSPTRKANDKKRKADLANFIVAVNKYKVTTGTYPSTEPTFFAKDFEQNYVTKKLKSFSDPNTLQPYTLTPVANVQTPPGLVLGNIQYQWPGACIGSEFSDTKNESKAAARLLLENGDTYCLNS